MQKNRYFGTDGIRGIVGKYPITPDFFLKLGWAIGKFFSKSGSKRIIIGKDTRISGYMLESALEAGLSSAGISVSFTGPMPTPAIAYLTRTFRAEAGIVISASHNPFYDNGIKIFSTEGKKISDKTERYIEKIFSQSIKYTNTKKLGKSSRILDAVGRYIEFCKGTFPNELNLKGIKMVVDCANGSTYHIAPNVFEELGAKVVKIGCQPNGININKNCGSTDIKNLKKKVVLENANLGIAYDGDGDRTIMVDQFGNKVDGDKILYIIAKEKIRKRKLSGGVVGTIMSNMGLECAFKKIGVPFVRSKVGDRYVLEKMQNMGWKFGAENSGHVILLDKTTTGDGIITTLAILSIMIRNEKTLYDLSKEINLFPQVNVNLNFKKNKKILNLKTIKKIKEMIKKKFSDIRVVVRNSGTEPYIRIMVEGKSKKNTKISSELISKFIKEHFII
ncbi:phosphoglucosamine mutase [bacterium endosymbiont of Pedicinus badii]|uniref:phosphoglucosamine mutase n=1 Tax=bacterium endosymbiont of Pedicinus badii TaxID=1719126 RepID=UPI0009B9E74B|nr:phosphoglucosamine mutase [bacterium endosymbiont of Pedicinus badii]OQM34271.1 phosphoglucosamine mutase [bacterium endosymbiont of Pedicinus badii]